MWNHVITCKIMCSYVKFNMWKNFTWNHMWNFTNERISHEIICDISHVKGFQMKSHVTFHMWKDFTWNYKWNFTCERSSHEIINYKWNFTCERISHEITNYKWHFTCERISHEITNYKWNFTCEKIRISYDITNYKVKFHMYVKGFHMKLRLKFHMWKVSQEVTLITMKFHMWKLQWNFTNSHDITNYKVKFHMYVRERISHEITTEISHVKGFARNYKLQWNFAFERISHEITSSGGARPQKLGGIWGANSYFLGGKIELLNK
jgi:hypothetical protein